MTDFLFLAPLSNPTLFHIFVVCFGVAPVSLSFSLHLLSYPDVPKLTDVTFQDVSDTTISLSWSPLNTTAITGYRITVMAVGESVPIFEDFVQPTTGKYTVYGLEPGIDYDVTVITVTENGESEPTTITQQTCKSVLSVCTQQIHLLHTHTYVINPFALSTSLLRHYFRGFLTFCFLYLLAF